MTPDELAIARAQIENAHVLVGKLCDGSEQWRMSVPADPGRDTDLIITEALVAGQRMAVYIDKLESERKEEP